VLQLLGSLGQQLKVIILEVGGSPMSGTVVKILANNPSAFCDDLLRLAQVAKVTTTTNEMALAAAEGAAEGQVTFTFHIELNLDAAKGPLYMAEWPMPTRINPEMRKIQETANQKGWFWAS